MFSTIINLKQNQCETLLLNHAKERYVKFLEYQNIANDILIELNRICKENEIDMFLAYGTLLGAVRDNSPIPWDYDVEVQVPYKQKNKLGTDLV